MGLHLCLVWTEDTRDACQSTVAKVDKEACSSFSNPLSASDSTQWRLVSLRCPHQFMLESRLFITVCEAVLFLRGHTVFWKGNIPSQILQIRTEIWVSRRLSFPKRQYSVSIISNSPNYGRKNWVCMRGCRQIHAYWLHIYKVLWKKSRQLSWNLARGAHHSGSIRELEEKKNCCEAVLFFFLAQISPV
jgi:hypothetical protein